MEILKQHLKCLNINSVPSGFTSHTPRPKCNLLFTVTDYWCDLLCGVIFYRLEQTTCMIYVL